MGTILNFGRGAGALLGVAAVVTACSDTGTTGTGAGDGPHVVVTTDILGDITGHVVGDAARITTLMPAGADPHAFDVSSRQAEETLEADLVVTVGAGFEENLTDLLEQAGDAGVETFALTDHVDLLAAGADGHDHEGEGTGHEGHDHEPGSVDPHVWTDPSRVEDAVSALGDTVAELDGVDPETVHANVADYQGQLADLDAEIATLVEEIPEPDRVLVTNHEVFGYLADGYGFEVLGTVIPSTSTLADVSPGELEDLQDSIGEHGVAVVFVETTHAGDEAEALARSTGIEVVELYSESLGDAGSGAETYLDMMRTNAERIADALS